jgi:DnaK suppressor protein
MTDTAGIKVWLEARLHELTARAVDIDDSLSEPGDDDWSEQAIESADDEVLEKVGDATLDEIRQIELTLSQIKAGKYGTCMGCGRSIAAERLKALPYATKCVKCA